MQPWDLCGGTTPHQDFRQAPTTHPWCPFPAAAFQSACSFNGDSSYNTTEAVATAVVSLGTPPATSRASGSRQEAEVGSGTAGRLQGDAS